jgi:hypothetical protein
MFTSIRRFFILTVPLLCSGSSMLYAQDWKLNDTQFHATGTPSTTNGGDYSYPGLNLGTLQDGFNVNAFSGNPILPGTNPQTSSFGYRLERTFNYLYTPNVPWNGPSLFHVDLNGSFSCAAGIGGNATAYAGSSANIALYTDSGGFTSWLGGSAGSPYGVSNMSDSKQETLLSHSSVSSYYPLKIRVDSVGGGIPTATASLSVATYASAGGMGIVFKAHENGGGSSSGGGYGGGYGGSSGSQGSSGAYTASGSVNLTVSAPN